MNTDQGCYVCGLFIDLRKAFDTIDHIILIKKLNYHGIRSISNKWFQSYLVNRQQSVSLHNSESSRLKLLWGVPQRYTLGPLLFLIYKNGLHKAFVNLNMTHFGDDTNLFF